MRVERDVAGDLLTLIVSGPLDHDAARHFLNEVEACIREGFHKIVVDLSQVDYVNTAAILAFEEAKNQLDELNGLFGIYNTTPTVESVLKRAKNFEALYCDPDQARGIQSSGSMTISLSGSTRFASGAGIDMEIYHFSDPGSSPCELIGDAGLLFDSSAGSRHTHNVSFDRSTVALGLGTLSEGKNFDSACGEMLTAGGAAAQSPQFHGGLPDYAISSGDYHPGATLAYGMQYKGNLSTLIRFWSAEPGQHIRLSSFVDQSLIETKFQAAAIVILADSAGLVGAQLRRVPEFAAATADELFKVPNIRGWLSFTPDRLYRRNLALITGFVCRGSVDESSPGRPFLRRMAPEGDLWSHFHAAVFPYHPLKKRTLKLHKAVSDLFEEGEIQDVLHLIHDDRPGIGSGESELLSGACWIGEIDRFETAKETT